MKLKIVAVSIFLGMYLHAFHIDIYNVSFIPVHPKPITDPLTNYFLPVRSTFKGTTVITDSALLGQAARDTLNYIKFCQEKRADIIDPEGMRSIVSVDQVKRTLAFIVTVADYDRTHGTALLSDPAFLTRWFDVVAWKADDVRARAHNFELPSSGAIRTTNYAIFSIPGSRCKTKKFPCALYALKRDRVSVSYTKQEIVAGALERNKHRSDVTPLAWVTRDGLEDALMQGTVMVTFAQRDYAFFNIYKHNGRSYDRSIADMRKQKRYWFFKDVSGNVGNAWLMKQKIERRKQVVFAGDVYNIGIGKVIALLSRNAQTQEPEVRIGILADMGGAFINNLYQLDVFSGIFSSRAQWREQTAHLPSYAHAYILKKKEGA